MAIIGIHDADFFTYENVMPNLECAKLYTYYNRHNNISVLTPAREPSKYTKFVIRKDYDDGNYPNYYFQDNCEYGGRAFQEDQYFPLAPAVEETIPDMHIYDRYASFYAKSESGQKELSRILNCAHIRLAPDGTNILPQSLLAKNFIDKKTGIIIHDYDISSINGSYEAIAALANNRYFKDTNIVNPYPVGTKYPLKVYSEADYRKWNQLDLMAYTTALQYNGILSDELAKEISQKKRLSKQFIYNPTYNIKDEDDFLINYLPKIYDQILFFHKAGFKILLIYDNSFVMSKELENLFKLINAFMTSKFQSFLLPGKQTLYNYCKQQRIFFKYESFHKKVTITLDDAREAFQYIRVKNYDLFTKFYTCE